MRLIITNNNGEELGEIRSNFEFEAEIPFEDKERIRALMRSAKKFAMDVGPVERSGGADERELITPGEEVVEFETGEALPRVKVAIDRMTRYHAVLEETEEREAIKAIDAPFNAPDGKEVHEGPPGFFYYNVSKDSEESGDGEVLEVRDYYRVWVRDQDSVPDDSMALYDEEGDPAGNHWYYEVPFETKTRINLSEHDVDPCNVIEKDADVELSPEEITEYGVCKADNERVREAAEAVEKGEPVWGDTYSVSGAVLKSIECPSVLLCLYKMFHNAGDEYTKYLPPIQSELKSRGVEAIDKITRKKRDFGQACDDVTLEKSGDWLEFERE